MIHSAIRTFDFILATVLKIYIGRPYDMHCHIIKVSTGLLFKSNVASVASYIINLKEGD
jgi:hypothetical protein